jgi:hypothetical protein
MPSYDSGRLEGVVAAAGGDQPPRNSAIPNADRHRADRGLRITPHDVWVFGVGGLCLALLAGLIAAIAVLLG